MSLTEAAHFSGEMPKGLRAGDERFFEDHIGYDLPSVWTVQLHDIVFNEAGELFDAERVLEASFLSPRHLARDIPRFARRHRLAWADPVRLGGAYVWITDRMSHNYYHWICDCLPRLEAWLLKHGEADLLLPRRVMAQPFVTDSLQAYRQVRVTGQPEGFSARVDQLTLPDRVSAEGYQHPVLAAKVAARMRAHFAGDVGQSSDRLYVSRAHSRFRRLANEAEVLPVLARHGFARMHLETMRFGEQVRLLAGARALCGPHGAGLTNMAFMQPGKVVELRQMGGTPNCFFTLANVGGHAYFPVACEAQVEGLPVHTADIVADPKDVERALALL
jgi:capsular polysaccharide biosynthesis protein